MFAGVFERETGPGEHVFHGLRDQHVVRPAERAHPRADVDGDAAHGVTVELDLAGVQPGADLDAEFAHAGDDGGCASQRLAGRGERREEPVPSGIDLPAVIPA